MLLSIISQIELPTVLTPFKNEILHMLGKANLVVCHKGDYLFQEGQPYSSVYFAPVGLFRCFYQFEDQEINLRLLGNQVIILPFESFSQQFTQHDSVRNSSDCPQSYPQTYTQQSPAIKLIANESIQCLETNHVLQIPLSIFLTAHPEPNIEQARLNLLLFILSAHYQAIEQRLRMIQHKKGKDRYAYFCKVMPEKIIKEMPNYHIASYLGMTAEAFSRIKSS